MRVHRFNIYERSLDGDLHGCGRAIFGMSTAQLKWQREICHGKSGGSAAEGTRFEIPQSQTSSREGSGSGGISYKELVNDVIYGTSAGRYYPTYSE